VVSAGKKGLHSVARHIGVRGRAWLLSVVKLSSRRQRSGLKIVQLPQSHYAEDILLRQRTHSAQLTQVPSKSRKSLAVYHSQSSL
jgi:hypothetical protein